MNKESYAVIKKDAIEIIDFLGDSVKTLAGKTVLITGAGGVVGSYIVDTLYLLNEMKYLWRPVRCICITHHRVIPESRIGHLFGKKYIHFIVADVTKKFSPPRKPDYIIHCASYASPKTYLTKPVETMEANSLGTKRMLDLALRYRVKNMVFISAGAVYGESRKGEKPFTEDHHGYVSPLEPRAVYSESKRFGETLCAVYARFYGVHATIARLSNMFGPGFRLDDGRAIPDFFNQAFTNSIIEVNTGSSTTRAYLYISDAIAGILTILLKGKRGEAYNIASEKLYTMKQVAAKICSFFPECKVIIRADRSKSYLSSSPKHHVASAQKLQRELGWRQLIGMDEGLDRLYAWYNGEIDAPGFV